VDNYTKQLENHVHALEKKLEHAEENYENLWYDTKEFLVVIQFLVMYNKNNNLPYIDLQKMLEGRSGLDGWTQRSEKILDEIKKVSGVCKYFFDHAVGDPNEQAPSI